MNEFVRERGSREATVVAAGKGTTVEVLIAAAEGPHFALRRFVMEPGGGMPLHTNRVEHEQYILEGSAAVRIGDETYEVSAGDAVLIPGGVPHAYQAGQDGFAFICVVPNADDKITILE